ncbi:MAG: nucleotide pyrophosphohydrolase [Clostridia bacterium]|nr:nucleotide pyrophosphohydrolase [Clostridia bacterium]
MKTEVTIGDMQEYLTRRYGGWATEQGMFMKLVEEIGEVAEVLNKRAGRKAAEGEDLGSQLGEELADMVHYIVAIAGINGIDLSEAILKKDVVASKKYNHEDNLQMFICDREKYLELIGEKVTE